MSRGTIDTFVTMNVKTGEMLEGVPMYVAPKIRWKENWFMIFQDALGDIAKDREMTGVIFRVWFCMMSKLGFENYILVQQSDIAKELGLHRQAVHRAMKVIIDKKLIIEGPKAGSMHSYRLNSSVGWRGKITNLSLRRYQEM